MTEPRPRRQMRAEMRHLNIPPAAQGCHEYQCTGNTFKPRIAGGLARMATDRPLVGRLIGERNETLRCDESGHPHQELRPDADHFQAAAYWMSMRDARSSLGTRATRSMTALSRRRISA